MNGSRRRIVPLPFLALAVVLALAARKVAAKTLNTAIGFVLL